MTKEFEFSFLVGAEIFLLFTMFILALRSTPTYILWVPGVKQPRE
jgi:hypothetical protein